MGALSCLATRELLALHGPTPPKGLLPPADAVREMKFMFWNGFYIGPRATRHCVC